MGKRKTFKKQLGRPVRDCPQYREIAQNLRKRIAANEWPTGKALPTVRQFGMEYSTSVVTISRALKLLRDEGRVGPNLARRLVVREVEGAPSIYKDLVVQVCSSFGSSLYDINSVGRMQQEIQKTVAGISDSFWMLTHYKYCDQWPEKLDALSLKGVLLFGHFQKAIFKRFETLPAPVVLVDRPPEKYQLHAACVDNFKAACEATDKLLALGHRRIAFVRLIQLLTRAVDPDSRERQSGYMHSLKQAGLGKQYATVLSVSRHDQVNSDNIRAMLKRKPRPTAFLAADPSIAQLILETAKLMDLEIPGDLSLVCFQGTQADLPQVAGPRTDFSTLGKAAALLIKKPKRPLLTTRLPAIWKEGNSIGAPPRS